MIEEMPQGSDLEGQQPRMLRLDACPVCGHGPASFSFASIDLLHEVPGVFAYDVCRGCGSFFQNPRAIDDDLTLYYPADYFTHNRTAPRDQEDSSGPLQALVRRLVLGARGRPREGAATLSGLLGRVLGAVGFLRRRAMYGLADELGTPGGAERCLELGPGTGDDMWRLARLGWTVTGIDVDPAAAEVAAARSGCEVLVGSVLDHRPGEAYGLIYSSHSLEHVPELGETIIHLSSLLAAAGRLVLIIPNPRSLSARLYGPLSVVWDPPRHLSLPSVRALRTVLGEAGFDDVHVRTVARRAGHYCSIAHARRLGTTGTAAWNAEATRVGRLLHAVEMLMVRLGLPVGEEIIVSATAR